MLLAAAAWNRFLTYNIGGRFKWPTFLSSYSGKLAGVVAGFVSALMYERGLLEARLLNCSCSN